MQSFKSLTVSWDLLLTNLMCNISISLWGKWVCGDQNYHLFTCHIWSKDTTHFTKIGCTHLYITLSYVKLNFNQTLQKANTLEKKGKFWISRPALTFLTWKRGSEQRALKRGKKYLSVMSCPTSGAISLINLTKRKKAIIICHCI